MRSIKTVYKHINVASFQDTRLSPGAMGVMAFLLAKSDTWKAHIYNISNEFKKDGLRGGGMSAIRTYVKELYDLGYLILRPERNENGTFCGKYYEIVRKSPNAQYTVHTQKAR
jgi:hypothetical protein